MEDGGNDAHVIGPDGEHMTPADLPAPRTRRWVARRKARVVTAVEGGLISRCEALKYYSLSEEEYESWKVRFMRDGLKGLRVTKLKKLRGTAP